MWCSQFFQKTNETHYHEHLLFSKYSQDSELRSFSGRIENTINCFQDLLTFSYLSLGTKKSGKLFFLLEIKFRNFFRPITYRKNWIRLLTATSMNSLWEHIVEQQTKCSLPAEKSISQKKIFALRLEYY